VSQEPRLTTRPPDPEAVLPTTAAGAGGPWLPCRHDDPELWFPVGNLADDDAYAAELCASCPLLAGCLRYALASPQCGVWGGVSEVTRLRLIRQTMAVPARAVAS
jgi:WhiB family transcriptional regulator, redox-sensing transcriptional regulator